MSINPNRNVNKCSVRSKRYTATIILLGVLSCLSATAQTTIKTGEVIVRGNVYQILDKDFIKVSFAEGSAELSNGSLTALADFAKTTRGVAKIDRFIVASWSDKNYPTKGEVSKGQKKLAELRAEHIKGALSAAGAEKVDTFEMTKQPNWIQRAFSTETAEINNQGMDLTANERLMKEIGKQLHDKGGPSTAVIVAKFKNEVSTK